jgi:hypothetical protein
LSTWNDELKADAIKQYLDQDPTPETSVQIVADVAENMGFTPNSVRMILSKAGVYVTKGTPAKKADKESGTKAAGTRVSKESAHAALTAAIEAAGKEVNEEVISKLTGKAAQYFTTLFK